MSINKAIKKVTDNVLDPVVMKKIIDMMLDAKNPDSNAIRKNVIKNITASIQKDTAFTTTLKGIIVEQADSVTATIVQKCIDEYREQLTNALVATINTQCEVYFDEQKKIIRDIIKKTLNNTINDIIAETKKLTDEHSKKLESKIKTDFQSVKVPMEYVEEVKKYIGYLCNTHE
jgi:hypothetical protein